MLGGSNQRQRTQENTTQTFTPDQGLVDRINPGLDRALGLMGNYTRTSQEDIDRFANPYLSQVGDATSAALMRSRDVTGNNLDAQAAKAGAFGGTGWGLLRGENNRAYADAEAQALAGINAGGYQSALGAAQGETANSNQFDMGALQTYLSGLGLMGNWGTTTGTGTSSSRGSGMQYGFNYGGGR